MKDKNATEPNC